MPTPPPGTCPRRGGGSRLTVVMTVATGAQRHPIRGATGRGAAAAMRHTSRDGRPGHGKAPPYRVLEWATITPSRPSTPTVHPVSRSTDRPHDRFVHPRGGPLGQRSHRRCGRPSCRCRLCRRHTRHRRHPVRGGGGAAWGTHTHTHTRRRNGERTGWGVAGKVLRSSSPCVPPWKGGGAWGGGRGRAGGATAATGHASENQGPSPPAWRHADGRHCSRRVGRPRDGIVMPEAAERAEARAGGGGVDRKTVRSPRAPPQTVHSSHEYGGAPTAWAPHAASRRPAHPVRHADKDTYTETG